MSVPIIIKIPKNLFPFFPDGVLQDIHYQLTDEQLVRVMKLRSMEDGCSSEVFIDKEIKSPKSSNPKSCFLKSESFDLKSRFFNSFQSINERQAKEILQEMTQQATHIPVFIRDSKLMLPKNKGTLNLRSSTSAPEIDACIKSFFLEVPDDELMDFKSQVFIALFPNMQLKRLSQEEHISNNFLLVLNSERLTILSNLEVNTELLETIRNIILQWTKTWNTPIN